MPPAAGNYASVQVDRNVLTALSITQRYSHLMGIVIMMDLAGVKQRERLHIVNDGFDSIQTLVEHYANDIKGFKSYLESLNKAFASARVATDKVYFTPPVMSKFVGAVHYFNQAVNTYHMIPDVLQLTQARIVSYSLHYKSTNEFSIKGVKKIITQLPVYFTV